jgi:hypothetical protein
VPGLNCYSCPGARFACPIGSLQAVLGSRSFHASCYVFGLLMAFGTLMGRWVCGWLCPFGLVQDLLYKVPFFHKEKNMPGHRYLNLLRYVMLLIFVLLLPELAVNAAGMGKPWFCEYICPSGTLLGGIPLVLANAGLRSAAAWRFLWKVMLLALILGLSMRYYRPFCKYLCPLGHFTDSSIRSPCTATGLIPIAVPAAARAVRPVGWAWTCGTARTVCSASAAARANRPARIRRL